MKREEFAEHLKGFPENDLFNLSKDTEASTFEANSIVRILMDKFELDSTNGFITGLMIMRYYILEELTRRYFQK